MTNQMTKELINHPSEVWDWQVNFGDDQWQG